MKTLITYNSKALANVKVFADKQMDKQTGQKQYARPIYLCGGIKNQIANTVYFMVSGRISRNIGKNIF